MKRVAVVVLLMLVEFLSIAVIYTVVVPDAGSACHGAVECTAWIYVYHPLRALLLATAGWLWIVAEVVTLNEGCHWIMGTSSYEARSAPSSGPDIHTTMLSVALSNAMEVPCPHCGRTFTKDEIIGARLSKEGKPMHNLCFHETYPDFKETVRCAKT